jgi:hydrogenase nickel insertion protein HypA
MHEATVASNVLNILQQRLESNPGTIAISVAVRIGEFRNVDTQSVAFAFDALKLSKPGCEDCRLIVEPIPVSAQCTNGHNYNPTLDNSYQCSCGAGIGKIESGEELDVTRVTLRATLEAAQCTK